MKIKLSKSQWQFIGKKAGWMKESAFEPKMMPGQEPYTEKELAQLHSLVDDAAKGDPSEQNENDNISKRRTIKVFFDNGDSLVTEINGTKQEIKDYYLSPKNNVASDYDMSKPNATRKVKNIQFLE